ncbi:histone-lysine N-methyltransferase SUVR3 [Syzygium oleosum]|uniref:histone-lysine N-methyltransferase SUVR3 n=1 Tax=Syzygium oleosum TaxID=219896 RepID=UPI0011D234DA|nr:histone-lysine N-methyltransferase SUVR3 [Syzygium oleosum]
MALYGYKRRQHQVADEEAESARDPLLRCADLILPWLTPQELAAVSLTSAGLRRASLSVARRRSSDAARGLEPLPVPFLSAVDSRPYAYFLYAPSSFSRALSPPNDALLPLRQPWGSSSRTVDRPTAFPSREAADVVVGGVVLGCGCERCEGRDCACWGGDGGGEEEEEVVVVVSECGPGCGCGSECGNRASQRGVEVRLKIARDKKKGWCLFADQAIEKGRFVCEYAGELLTTKEARARQKEYDELASSGGFSSALLVVREHLPSGKACLRINIDATKVGNVGRFINHSCDGGNLSTVLVRSTGALLPRLCFFASNDIREGEELSFSYGETRLRSNGLQCYCGASNCFGVLPSEHT